MIKTRLFLLVVLMMVTSMAMGQDALTPKYPVGDQQTYNQYIDAARRGDAEAQYQVGSSLDSRDVETAIAWMSKSGEQGNYKAVTVLVAIYSGVAGDEYVAYRNREKSRYWVEKCRELIEKGEGNVTTITMIGSMYYTGTDVDRDNEKALSLFRKAIAHPHPDNINWVAMAEFHLGLFYMNGTVVEQDDEQMFYWLHRAVGHLTPQCAFGGGIYFWLAKCYYNGDGTKQDIDQAIYYYEKSKAAGWKDAVAWLEKSKAKRQELLAAKSQEVVKEEETLPAAPVMDAMMNVDENIPQVSQQDRYSYAVIIGNEQYENEANVPFAENDASVFREYVLRTLGVPEKQIQFVTNAGLNRIRGTMRWLKDALEVAGGKGKAIIYYAGHGIPDEANKSAYLLPVDGIGSDEESAYSLARLYKELGAMPAERITVFLDACFSGAKREGDMMASARGVAIKVKEEAPQGKMIVFTAAQGDETAYPFAAQKHGMFTYYLLKKLKESQGNATLGELGDYLTSEVKRQSFVENNKVQTPSIVPAASMLNNWRGLSLK